MAQFRFSECLHSSINERGQADDLSGNAWSPSCVQDHASPSNFIPKIYNLFFIIFFYVRPVYFRNFFNLLSFND